MQDKTIGNLNKEESEQMQKYLKEISKIYGIRLAEIGEFLGKKLKDDAKGAHQWFIAFTIIDEIFDEMEEKILATLEDLGVIGSLSETNVVVDMSRRGLFKSIIRETKERIKEELPSFNPRNRNGSRIRLV